MYTGIYGNINVTGNQAGQPWPRPQAYFLFPHAEGKSLVTLGGSNR